MEKSSHVQPKKRMSATQLAKQWDVNWHSIWPPVRRLATFFLVAYHFYIFCYQNLFSSDRMKRNELGNILNVLNPSYSIFTMAAIYVFYAYIISVKQNIDGCLQIGDLLLWITIWFIHIACIVWQFCKLNCIHLYIHHWTSHWLNSKNFLILCQKVGTG